MNITDATAFLTLAGSQAHGTAGPGSDVDLRGVCIVPVADRLSLRKTFEQFEGDIPDALQPSIRAKLEKHPTAKHALDVKIEGVIFDVAKFLKLCANANPNALEILFADPTDWVMATERWQHIYDVRQMFLTKKIQQTFTGYAMAQLKKIRSHRGWLLNPPTKKPDRPEFGLPQASNVTRDDRHRIEEAIAARMRTYGVDDIEMPTEVRIPVNERIQNLVTDLLGIEDDERLDHLRAVASASLSLPPEVISTLNAERKYRTAMNQWQSYQTWKQHRNRSRAQLEAKHGYDTKHAMHLVRLMRMALEALTEETLRVRRPDFEELMAIREGRWSFDELITHADELKSKMACAAVVSKLPESVDDVRVDALVLKTVLSDTVLSQSDVS